jgi:type IV/VI secretion system ImpK/VasF family protein
MKNRNNELQALIIASPLLKFITPLLSMLAYAPSLHHSSNPTLLYQNLIYTLQNIELQLEGTYATTRLKLASYIICITLDELIIDPINFTQGIKLKRTLDYLYQDTQGEKRFFKIIDVLIEKAQISKDLLILAYLCLALGYRGKFQEKAEDSFIYLTRKIYSILHNPNFMLISDNSIDISESSTRTDIEQNHWASVSISSIVIGLSAAYAFFAFTVYNYTQTLLHLF